MADAGFSRFAPVIAPMGDNNPARRQELGSIGIGNKRSAGFAAGAARFGADFSGFETCGWLGRTIVGAEKERGAFICQRKNRPSQAKGAENFTSDQKSFPPLFLKKEITASWLPLVGFANNSEINLGWLLGVVLHCHRAALQCHAAPISASGLGLLTILR